MTHDGWVRWLLVTMAVALAFGAGPLGAAAQDRPPPPPSAATASGVALSRTVPSPAPDFYRAREKSLAKAIFLGFIPSAGLFYGEEPFWAVVDVVTVITAVYLIASSGLVLFPGELRNDVRLFSGVGLLAARTVGSVFGSIRGVERHNARLEERRSAVGPPWMIRF